MNNIEEGRIAAILGIESTDSDGEESGTGEDFADDDGDDSPSLMETLACLAPRTAVALVAPAGSRSHDLYYICKYYYLPTTATTRA